ncbi:hypothetical protein HMPREF1330_01482 [Enterococcus faecalis ERV129]|nr:hypothetical protein HMPREF1330_01482 [Enterococcus faecalis ERV129]EJV10918.1 hypothetical protein HMPREF1334_01062 [Enterococcus faecalis ERV41]
MKVPLVKLFFGNSTSIRSKFSLSKKASSFFYFTHIYLKNSISILL